MIFATVGVLATASRMTWAFAREQGLPASVYLSRVLFPMGEQVAEWKLLTRCFTDRTPYVYATVVDRLLDCHKSPARSDQHWILRRVQCSHFARHRRLLLFFPRSSKRHFAEASDQTRRTYLLGSFQIGPGWPSGNHHLGCI